MTYAAEILSTLDRFLEADVEITLYGRAAFLLGFESPLEQFFHSHDVDGVLWMGQAEALMRESNFWPALELTNQALEPKGLYMSHLFVEDQVILRPRWKESRKKVGSLRLERITLTRLADEDLLLSKLMRDDPQDRMDAYFIISQRGWDKPMVKAIISEARVPPVEEISEQFELSSKKLLALI